MQQARITNGLLSINAVVAVGVVLKLMQPVLILLVALHGHLCSIRYWSGCALTLRLPLWAVVSLTGILALE